MAELLTSARRAAARSVNAVMTATYWEMGRRIVHVEQGGRDKPPYGEELIASLARDLTARFGRGFGKSRLYQMRAFYVNNAQILQTALAKSPGNGGNIFHTLCGKSGIVPKGRTAPDISNLAIIGRRFPLPWAAYVRLLPVNDSEAREFYEAEALRCGWSVRQLDRQIATQFYERTLLSRNKAAMLRKGEKPLPPDVVTPEQEIIDPFVLEFLDLKDEYSESDLEQALVTKLENFLLELGGDFAFVARQRRLRIGGEWYRIDLLFFHRRLRCLVVIDLKVDKFTHTDAGQMHMYLNYARENWTHPGENPPVGLILCAQKDSAVAKYALEGLPNKVMAAEYKLALPAPQILADELARTRKMLQSTARKPLRNAHND
jgi:predicted nuclease of restriction endonuclease-like (RecB) superfamily